MKLLDKKFFFASLPHQNNAIFLDLIWGNNERGGEETTSVGGRLKKEWGNCWLYIVEVLFKMNAEH